MDQSVISGLGNIYRAELLYRHRLSPFRLGRDVDPAVLDAMWVDICALMRDGVRSGRIVTVDPADVVALSELDTDRPSSDDPELDGGEDTPALRRRRRDTGVYVYRRAGRRCLRCGTLISAREVAGRRLFWCAGCQV
jgi:endonuclease-8